jgi:hypothetical protein
MNDPKGLIFRDQYQNLENLGNSKGKYALMKRF